MKTLAMGVIGLGRMGQHHCRVIANHRYAELAAVYDVSCTRAADFAQRYDAAACDTLDDLLDRVEAVVIATPTPTHFDLASRCVERGIHFMLEKPVTESLEQGTRLLEMVQHSGLVAQVGHIERFNPTFMELKKVIEDMSVIAVNFRRLSPFKGSNTDVDVVLDLMVHDLDLCNDLFGHQPHIAGVAGLSPLSNNLDHVVAQLCYPNGPVVTLTASRVTEEKIRSIEVTTKEAYIEADSLNKNISVHRRTTGIYTDQNHQGVKYRQESVIERIVVPTVEPLAAELGHFIECIQNNQEPCVSLQDGLEALRLALQIGDMAKEQTRQLEPAD